MKKELRDLLLLPFLGVIAAITGIYTGERWLELIGTGAGISTLVPIIVEWAKVQWNFAGKTWLFGYPTSRWVTWLFSFIFVYVAYWLEIFEAMGWIKAGVYALGVGLVANRYFHWSHIELFLAILFNREEKVAKLRAIEEAENEINEQSA